MAGSLDDTSFRVKGDLERVPIRGGPESGGSSVGAGECAGESEVYKRNLDLADCYLVLTSRLARDKVADMGGEARRVRVTSARAGTVWPSTPTRYSGSGLGNDAIHSFQCCNRTFRSDL